MITRAETQWCTLCGARFTDEEVEDAFGCPKCGDEGVPCACANDVTVTVNWHELRILGIWAEKWARHCANKPTADSRTMPLKVQAIARRLQRQHPDQPPLTLSQEMAELPAALKRAGIEHGGVESNVPRPSLIPINGPGAVKPITKR